MNLIIKTEIIMIDLPKVQQRYICKLSNMSISLFLVFLTTFFHKVTMFSRNKSVLQATGHMETSKIKSAKHISF